MKEVENILKILEQTKKAIEKEDVVLLKELSNQTIHTASISQDPDNIAVAVTVYSLGKIIERKNYQKNNEWNKFYRIVILSISNSIKSIKKKDEKGFKTNLRQIRKVINKFSGDLKKYIADVFVKAKINKASRIYEHGISMEKTAKLLGITMWELANYTGQTGISDVKESQTISIKSRIKLVKEMFE